jgi:hypothetical protein
MDDIRPIKDLPIKVQYRCFFCVFDLISSSKPELAADGKGRGWEGG